MLIQILCLIQRLFLSVLCGLSRRYQIIEVVIGNLSHWVRLHLRGSLCSRVNFNLLRTVELTVTDKTLLHHFLSLFVLLKILLQQLPQTVVVSIVIFLGISFLGCRQGSEVLASLGFLLLRLRVVGFDIYWR